MDLILEVTSTTVVIEICTAFQQPFVDDLQQYIQTRSKLPCVLQLQLSPLHCALTIALHLPRYIYTCASVYSNFNIIYCV